MPHNRIAPLLLVSAFAGALVPGLPTAAAGPANPVGYVGVPPTGTVTPPPPPPGDYAGIVPPGSGYAGIVPPGSGSAGIAGRPGPAPSVRASGSGRGSTADDAGQGSRAAATGPVSSGDLIGLSALGAFVLGIAATLRRGASRA